MTPAQLAEIHYAAFETQRPWSEVEFADLLALPHTFLVTATDACFAIGRSVAGETELLTIACHPDRQRKGLARQCIRDFFKKCQDQSTQHVFLEVDAQNLGAISLYSELGFTKSGTRKAYYSHPDGSRSDAVLMSISFDRHAVK